MKYGLDAKLMHDFTMKLILYSLSIQNWVVVVIEIYNFKSYFMKFLFKLFVLLF